MGLYKESRLVQLTGSVDGHNRTYQTPTQYEPGSIKVMINGQVQDVADERLGWEEVAPNAIEMFVAPKVGDFIQAFYRDQAGIIGLDDVQGSPFDPEGRWP